MIVHFGHAISNVGVLIHSSRAQFDSSTQTMENISFSKLLVSSKHGSGGSLMKYGTPD